MIVHTHAQDEEICFGKIHRQDQMQTTTATLWGGSKEQNINRYTLHRQIQCMLLWLDRNHCMLLWLKEKPLQAYISLVQPWLTKTNLWSMAQSSFAELGKKQITHLPMYKVMGHKIISKVRKQNIREKRKQDAKTVQKVTGMIKAVKSSFTGQKLHEYLKNKKNTCRVISYSIY